MKVFLKVLMWVVIVVAVIFLVLWVTVLVTKEFDTIPQLLTYLVERFREGTSAA